MPHKLVTSLIAVTCLCQPFYAQANSWFEVEVFVFERQGQQTKEQWDDVPPTPVSAKAVDLISPVITTDITGVALGLSGCSSNDWFNQSNDCHDPLNSQRTKSRPSEVPFSIAADTEQQAYLGDEPILLAESQSEFGEIISTMRRESGVKPLIHLTWQQDMQSKRRSKPVRIYAGKDYSEEYNFHGEAVTKTVSPDEQQQDTTQLAVNDFGNFDMLLAPTSTPAVWALDGTINIYLSHYLYIEHSLSLRQEAQRQMDVASLYGNVPVSNINAQSRSVSSSYTTTQSSTASQQVQYRPFLQAIPIKQNRRVRSGEVHYFDHPQMGIVMQIRKMEQPTTARPIDLSLPEEDSLVDADVVPQSIY